MGILILENIWWDLNQQNSSQASVLPYFEGLSRSNEDIQIYYMTFIDTKGFENSLAHLLTAPQERLFIYVASHGYGARLGNSNFSNISAIIGAAVSADRGKRVEGVIYLVHVRSVVLTMIFPSKCSIGGQVSLGYSLTKA